MLDRGPDRLVIFDGDGAAAMQTRDLVEVGTLEAVVSVVSDDSLPVGCFEHAVDAVILNPVPDGSDSVWIDLPPAEPRQVTVGVIDDGAQGGPATLATAVVPLR
jgi:hypothetical protein